MLKYAEIQQVKSRKIPILNLTVECNFLHLLTLFQSPASIYLFFLTVFLAVPLKIFGNNLATLEGGFGAFFNVVVNFNGNTIFRNNSAKYGGGFHAQGSGSTINFSGSSTFGNNLASIYGGVGVFFNNTVSFSGNTL